MTFKALVIGRAVGVWDEVAALQAMCTFDTTIVVNETAVDYPGHIDHWVSFHANMLPIWREKRIRKGYPEADNFWTVNFRGHALYGRKPPPLPKPLNRIECQGGSSGLAAVEVALKVGAGKDPRVALAGIPMAATLGHYNAPDKPWDEALHHLKKWQTEARRLIGPVRSMSGWTKEFLGGEPPTKEWLEG